MSFLSESGPILHPTDFSEPALAAHPYSVYLAGLLDADLHLVHVEEDGDGSGDSGFPVPTGTWSEVREWLVGSAAARGREPGEVEAPEVRRETLRGDEPANVILSYAADVGAGAICVGTHGRGGLGRLVLGSVTEEVIRKAGSPVMTVRPEMRGWGDNGPRRFLVGADLSSMMKPALAWAGVLAAATGADLTAAYVVTSHAGAAQHDQLQQIHAAFRDLDIEGVELDAQLLVGDPEVQMRDLAKEQQMDLVVTATHGRSGTSRLVIGSVTESLVRRAPCPVLSVSEPPPGLRGRAPEGDVGA